MKTKIKKLTKSEKKIMKVIADFRKKCLKSKYTDKPLSTFFSKIPISEYQTQIANIDFGMIKDVEVKLILTSEKITIKSTKPGPKYCYSLILLEGSENENEKVLIEFNGISRKFKEYKENYPIPDYFKYDKTEDKLKNSSLAKKNIPIKKRKLNDPNEIEGVKKKFYSDEKNENQYESIHPLSTEGKKNKPEFSIEEVEAILGLSMLEDNNDNNNIEQPNTVTQSIQEQPKKIDNLMTLSQNIDKTENAPLIESNNTNVSQIESKNDFCEEDEHHTLSIDDSISESLSNEDEKKETSQQSDYKNDEVNQVEDNKNNLPAEQSTALTVNENISENKLLPDTDHLLTLAKSDAELVINEKIQTLPDFNIPFNQLPSEAEIKANKMIMEQIRHLRDICLKYKDECNIQDKQFTHPLKKTIKKYKKNITEFNKKFQLEHASNIKLKFKNKKVNDSSKISNLYLIKTVNGWKKKLQLMEWNETNKDLKEFKENYPIQNYFDNINIEIQNTNHLPEIINVITTVQNPPSPELMEEGESLHQNKLDTVDNNSLNLVSIKNTDTTLVNKDYIDCNDKDSSVESLNATEIVNEIPFNIEPALPLPEKEVTPINTIQNSNLVNELYPNNIGIKNDASLQVNQNSYQNVIPQIHVSNHNSFSFLHNGNENRQSNNYYPLHTNTHLPITNVQNFNTVYNPVRYHAETDKVWVDNRHISFGTFLKNPYLFEDNNQPVLRSEKRKASFCVDGIYIGTRKIYKFTESAIRYRALNNVGLNNVESSGQPPGPFSTLAGFNASTPIQNRPAEQQNTYSSIPTARNQIPDGRTIRSSVANNTNSFFVNLTTNANRTPASMSYGIPVPPPKPKN